MNFLLSVHLLCVVPFFLCRTEQNQLKDIKFDFIPGKGMYVYRLQEFRPEDVSLLERCPHFRGWYVQASMELGPEDVSLLERCPHFRGWVCTGFNGVGT